MPIPKISEEQVSSVIHQVAEYIDRQRKTYRERAMPLNSGQRATMQSFFPGSTLDSARVLFLTQNRVVNPPFYPQLVRMGFETMVLPNFSLMAAITFMDTVVSHEPFTNKLLFHELVHVVQYERLGLEGFATKYVQGFLSGGSYEAIPLEMNAYELDGRFAGAPAKPFSVASEVDAWLDAGRF